MVIPATVKKAQAIPYHRISILVADDFSSFRNTIFTMLERLGVQSIAMASSAQSIVKACSREHFDIILCDYNLGAGKTGQHVLEELRFKNIIPKKTVFILVSAEAARTIVMSAYDCEPDDYLMKPVTAAMLQQRVDKMLLQRIVFNPVTSAEQLGEVDNAISLLQQLAKAEDRYAPYAQKWLGDMLIEQGRVEEAEQLYANALKARAQEWAKLGLAKCYFEQQQYVDAQEILTPIVVDNPLLLPAYDLLADTYAMQGQPKEQQKILQSAVNISPMSILRQKKLGAVAYQNNDLIAALEAKRKVVKLGALSCYGSKEDLFDFVRTAAQAIEKSDDVSRALVEEIKAMLEKLAKENRHDTAVVTRCNLLLSRVTVIHEGEVPTSESGAGLTVEKSLQKFNKNDDDIYFHLDYLRTLQALKNAKEFDKHLQFLLDKFSKNETSLQLLDEFLEEPVSIANRDWVAQVNKQGIELYTNQKFDEAIRCFEEAQALFPKHIGIALNIVQAMAGKIQNNPNNSELIDDCDSYLNVIESQVDRQHTQFDRYVKIKKMALAARG